MFETGKLILMILTGSQQKSRKNPSIVGDIFHLVKLDPREWNGVDQKNLEVKGSTRVC